MASAYRRMWLIYEVAPPIIYLRSCIIVWHLLLIMTSMRNKCMHVVLGSEIEKCCKSTADYFKCSSVERSNAVLSTKTTEAESSEFWEMWEGEFGEVSESGNSGVVTYSEPEGSLHSFPHLTVPGLWCVQLFTCQVMLH